MSITEMYPAPAVAVAPRCQAAAVAEQLASLVAGLDVDGLDGEEAAELTLAFARIERLGAAAKTLAAGQVAQSGYCRQAGFDTAARWLANATKDNPWEAARAIETAQHLGEEDLGETRRAFLAGELTATQANEIATAAIRSPAEQDRLLGVAGSETMGRLRFECRKVRLADRPPPEPKTKARDTANEMSFGHREVGGDMSELFVRMPTAWLVLVLAAVRHQCDAVFAKARAEGREYPHQAYMVEALVTLLLIGGIDAPAGPFDDAEGDAAGGEAGDGPFDDAGVEAEGDATDGDAVDGGAVDGHEADDEAPGAGDVEDPRAQGRAPGGQPGAAGASHVDNDLLHDQLLSMLRGEPPPWRPAPAGAL